MKRKNIFFFAVSVLFLAFLIFYFFQKTESSIIGNQEILKEIDRLLIPVYYQNATDADFEKLKELAKGDAYANGEISEILLMAKYKEYSHIGHSLGFIYSYVKTGKKLICPGHSLSHYYIFLKHNETDSATENLNDAIKNFPAWKSQMEMRNESWLSSENYGFYKDIINSSISKIESGNSGASDGEISNLSEAPCV